MTSVEWNGYDLLREAIFQRESSDVENLLNQGVTVNIGDAGTSPLHFAVQNGYPEIVQLLLDKGAEINNKDHSGRAPLHYSSKRQVQIADFDLWVHKGGREEPLHGNGFRYFNCEIAEALFLAGANPNVKDNDGNTPLHMAVKNGLIDLSGLLLAFGADKDNKNHEELTALDLAGKPEGNKVIFAHLSEWDGNTRLHYAAAWGSTRSVEAFIAQGDDINTRDIEGATPLHRAAIMKNLLNFEFLVSKGARLDIKDNNGWTVLHSAVRGGSDFIVEKLIKCGLDVNAKDEDDDTPLHCGASSGKYDIVHFLLANGALKNIRNKNGLTALDVAEDRAFDKLVQLLRPYEG